MTQARTDEPVTGEFEALRPYLLRVAYSHLGSPQATRQLATRARQAVEARRPRYPAGPDEQREVVSAFHAATENGDLATLLELHDPAGTFRSDGGGLVNAARKVFTGAERVARIFTAMARHFGGPLRMTPILVNGSPGLLMETGGSPTVIAFTLDQGRISEIDLVRNPEKLRTLPGASAHARRPRPADAVVLVLADVLCVG